MNTYPSPYVPPRIFKYQKVISYIETLTRRKLDDLQKDIITALIEQEQRKK